MTDSDRPARRKNGLSPPFTSAQVSTWFTLPTLVLEFLIFVSPVLPLEASIPCTLLFCGTALLSAYYGIQAMRIDPADPRLFSEDEHNNGTASNSSSATGMNGDDPHHAAPCKWDPQEPTKHCWICDVTVAEKSMHCKFCNKCVYHFDHHCMWLNTCVGRANYHYFYGTMLSITFLLLIHAAIQAGVVLDIYFGSGTCKDLADEWFGVHEKLVVVVVLGVFLLFDLLALSLIGQLLSFHHKLRREGLTTYQFIVRENQKKREQAKVDHALYQRRTGEMLKAQEEHRNMDAFRLKCGGYLRSKCGIVGCDPLQVDPPPREDDEEEVVFTNGHSKSNGQEEAKEPEDI